MKNISNKTLTKILIAVCCVAIFLVAFYAGMKMGFYSANEKTKSSTASIFNEETSGESEAGTSDKETAEASEKQDSRKNVSSDASGAFSADTQVFALPQASSGGTAEKSNDSASSAAQPTYIEDISDIEAGTVIPTEKFDYSNKDNYFISSVIEENDGVYQRIINKSYRANDDIGLGDLRYLKVVHINFDNQIQVGEIIVNAALAEEFLRIFEELFVSGYQIKQMHLVDNYWTIDGDKTDTASINVDNTSAFNYRLATSSSHLSQHAYGCAIDLNPLENPYVTYDSNGNAKTYHENAQEYKENRTEDEPHVITHEDIAYQIFHDEHGFEWGGDWSNPKDFQHFQKKIA